jgi:hypothetical protein
MPKPSPLNPDCAQGKHDACAGDAWDFTLDERATCQCLCHAAARPVAPNA